MSGTTSYRGRKQAVVNHIRECISSGYLACGDSLPSMQVLGDSMNVSPTTVLTALREMEQDGTLRCLPNGTRIVAGASEGAGILGRAILFLTAHTQELGDREKQASLSSAGAGWEVAVDHAASVALRSTRSHMLILRSSEMTSADVAQLLRHPPRGLVVTNTEGTQPAEQLIHELCERRVPVVKVGSANDAGSCDSVASDHRAGARDLTRWLIGRGCRRILRFWCWPKEQPRLDWLAQRDAGYEDACREAGIEVLPPLQYQGVIRTPMSPEDVQEDAFAAAGRLWEHLRGPQPVDAIMTVSDGMATTVAAACRTLRLVPNQDVAIVGYDNYWHNAPWLAWESTPPLATVDKQNLLIGQEMVNLLMDRMEGKLPPEPQHRLVAPKLVVTGQP